MLERGCTSTQLDLGSWETLMNKATGLDKAHRLGFLASSLDMRMEAEEKLKVVWYTVLKTTAHHAQAKSLDVVRPRAVGRSPRFAERTVMIAELVFVKTSCVVTSAFAVGLVAVRAKRSLMQPYVPNLPVSS